MNSNDTKSVSLVLGSGGARGNAHIGVIRWLEEHGYEIRSVAGTSVGALVGGVYAAGKLDEFEDWVRALDERDILRLLDLSWDLNGLVKGDRIMDALGDFVGDRNIEDLPIAYTAVAANLDTEKEVWIRDGLLFDAIRCSISLPLFFKPRIRNGKTLVDGGILNPVPIAPTFADETDLSVAVMLGARPSDRLDRPRKTIGEDGKPEGLRARIEVFIDRLGIGRDGERRERGPIDIASETIDAMQATIARQKLAAYPPDVLIEIPRNACTIIEFDRAAELIELGYDAADRILGDRKEQECRRRDGRKPATSAGHSSK